MGGWVGVSKKGKKDGSMHWDCSPVYCSKSVSMAM